MSFEQSLRASPIRSPMKRTASGGTGTGRGVRTTPSHSPKPTTLPMNALAPTAPTAPTLKRSPWEPPLSCQRRLMGQQLFFPLELCAVDYVSRVLRLLGTFLSAASSSSAASVVAGAYVGGEAGGGEEGSELLQLLRAYGGRVRVWGGPDASLLSLLSQAPYDAQVRAILAAHEAASGSGSGGSGSGGSGSGGSGSGGSGSGGSGRLPDLSSLFVATRLLVTGVAGCAQEWGQGQGEVGVCAAEVLQELEQWEQQLRHHRTHKEQRMELLGWQWDAGGGAGGAAEQGGYSSLSIDIGQGQGQEQGGAEEQEGAEVAAQIGALLQPTTLSNVTLFHRLLCVCGDLDALLRALSEDGEYAEAQRLRQLRAAVEATVTQQGRGLLDQVRAVCTQAQVLSARLGHISDDLRVTAFSHPASLDTAQRTEDLSRLLAQQCSRLSAAGVAPFSLLGQEGVVGRLSAEGAAFITADFLFAHPHSDGGDRGDMGGAGVLGAGQGQGQTSIGSLVIRAGSNTGGCARC
ncbi:hypothetical protein B484DRAFT_390266 [Ochromonadaceae sp. CCMP2298]|nr:hypothetical protein B484DRAFT_390266 [Ochromonadaceae sp. CCMP2298]